MSTLITLHGFRSALVPPMIAAGETIVGALMAYTSKTEVGSGLRYGAVVIGVMRGPT
jgi:hypothetical protein